MIQFSFCLMLRLNSLFKLIRKLNVSFLSVGLALFTFSLAAGAEDNSENKGLLTADAKSAISAPPPAAETQESAEQEQPAKLSPEQVRINKFETEKLKALASISKLTRKLRQISTQKARHEQERISLESQILDYEQKIAPLQEDLNRQKVKVRQQVLNLYKMNGAEFIKNLFSSESPMRLERRAKFIHLKLNKDMASLIKYRSKIKILKNSQQLVQLKLTKLEQVEREISQKEAEIRLENQAKQSIVQRIEGVRRELVSQFKQTRNLLLTKDMKILLKNALAKDKGELDWPALGKVTHRYGVVKDPNLKTQTPLRGIFMQTQPHIEVHSIADGNVVWLQDLQGYGQVLLLDHGHNYYSLYGMLQDTALKRGETVKRNQRLGHTGYISQRFGTGLYFEIRHFSEPEDPLRWLKKKSFNISQSSEGEFLNAQRD